jgi:hypothetical protein
MEWSGSWESNGLAASQDWLKEPAVRLPRLQDSILSYAKLIQTKPLYPTYFWYVLLLSQPGSSGISSSGFPTEMVYNSYTLVTYSTDLILFDLTTIILFDDN